MTANRQTTPNSRRAQARVATPIIAVLAVLALGGAITGYIFLPGLIDVGEDEDQGPPTLSQEQINTELGRLQKVFQDDLQQERELDNIEDETRAFIARAKDEPGGYILLAQILIARKAWLPAYEAWARALELDPSPVEVHKMAGFSAAKVGDNKRAVAHYLGAIDASGGHADNQVYNALGRLHLAMGDPDKAEQAFNKAIKAKAVGEKTNWQHAAYSGLADVAAYRKDFEAAEAWIKKAIKFAAYDSDADEVSYAIQRARLFMDAGDETRAQEALTVLGRGVPQSVTRIESIRLQAKLYERAGDLGAAADYAALRCAQYHASADRDDEKLANLYAVLADWQIKAGRIQNALRSIDNIRQLNAEHPAVPQLRKRVAAKSATQGTTKQD